MRVLRPNLSERFPPTMELTTLLTCSADQSSGMAAPATPASCARRMRNASVEFDSVKSETSTRKRLKLPSKPRSESFCGGGVATAAAAAAPAPFC